MPYSLFPWCSNHIQYNRILHIETISNFRFQEHLLLTDQTNLFQRKAISDAAQSQDQDSRKLIVQAASQNNKQLVTKRLFALALQNNEE